MSAIRIAVVAAAVLAVTGAVSAEQGDTEVGFRLVWVTGSATGAGTLTGVGGSPTLSSAPGIEVDWVLWPLDELSVELSLGASPHPIGIRGGDLAGLDLGSLWRLPVSAVAQYRPDLFGRFDPYVGLGVVYNAAIVDESSASKAEFSQIGFSKDVDVVAQLGVTYDLDVRWSANLDVRYMGWSTTGTLTSTDGTVDSLQLTMNPWVVGLGFRFRY